MMQLSENICLIKKSAVSEVPTQHKRSQYYGEHLRQIVFSASRTDK